LAKKLRPEFEKIYVTSDFTEALNMISGARVRNSNLVDLIIADGDLAAVRLVEAANARPLVLATSKLPVISTIILLDNHNEVEIREELRKVGGCNYILEKKHGEAVPYSTFAVMNAILDTLRRRRLVEYSYRDLRENVHKEYPHLAVFEDVQDTDLADNSMSHRSGSIISPAAPGSPTGTTVAKEGASAPKLTAKQMLEERIRKEEEDNEIGCDELDDWTTSSSMHPSFVGLVRKGLSPTASPPRETEGAGAGLGFPAPRTRDLQEEMVERRTTDAEAVRRLTAAIKERGNEPIRDNTSVVVDAYEQSQEILQKHREDARAAMERNKKANADTTLPLLQPAYVEKVYNDQKRPQWGYGDGHERSMLAEVELKQFIPRPAVNLQFRQRLTVAGLDKKMVGGCWNMINGVPKTKSHRAGTSAGNVSDLSPLVVHRSHSTVSGSVAAAAAAAAANAATFPPGSISEAGESLDGMDSLVSTVASSDGGRSRMSKRRTIIGDHDTSHCTFGGSNRPDHTQIVMPSLKQKIKAKKKGVRLLNKLAAHTPMEAQFCELLELDINMCAVSSRERDLLGHGKQAEKEKDYDQAIRYYERSTVTTKKPHVSLQFIGINLYTQKRYLEALRKFSEIMALAVVGPLPHKHNDIVCVPPSNYDLFVAHYNRGLVYFRLGDDTRGLKDMQKALEIKPHSVLAKEKLALAYRRMNKFDEAMGVTASIVQEKAEEKKRRAVAAAQTRHRDLIRATESLSTVPVDGEVESLLLESVVDEGGGEKEGDDGSVSTTGSRVPGSTSSSVNTGVSPMGSRAKRGTERSVAPTVNYAVQAMLSRAQKVDVGGKLVVSVKAKVAHRLQTGRVEGEDSSGGSILAMSLKDFKAMNGFKSDLAESIFVQPTDLQVALAHPPESRSVDHLETIASVLALVPSFQGAAPVVLRQVAACAEFRVFPAAAEVLAQNYPAACVGVVLRGEVQVRMEMEEAALAASFQSPNNLILEKITPVAAFGHIDMLFANPYLTKNILSDSYGDQLNAQEAKAVIERHNPNDQMGPDASPIKVPEPSVDREKHYNIELASDDHSLASGVSFETAGKSGSGGGGGGGEGADGADSVASGDGGGGVDAGYRVRGTSLETGEDMGAKERKFVDNMNSLEKAALMLGGDRSWSDDEADAPDISESVGGCRPGIFMSYRVQPLTEVLFIPPDMFSRHLIPSVRSELMSRLETIKACKVFEGFSYRSHVQLARMGMTQYFCAGEMIIDQGATPNFLYIVTKGMCKAYKKPNKVDILNKNLDQLRQRAADHDTRYHFHHRLRHNMVPAGDINSVPHDKGCGMYPTQLELDRYKLELEIKKLEQTIFQMEMEPSDDGSDVSSIDGGDDEDGENGELEEISVIQWPMLFGEACVISPANGISAGRIVADTPCEIFAIHKLQLQTFRIHSDFVELVKNHAILYPNDAHLVGGLSKKKYWDEYKVKYVQELRARKAQLKELSKS